MDFSNDYAGLDNSKVEDHIDLYGYNSDTRLDEKNKGYSPLSAFFNLRFLIMAAAAVLCIWHGVVADTESTAEIVTGAILVLLSAVFAATEIVKNTYCDKYFFELKARSKSEFRIVRSGEIRNIRRELIVPDDIIVLEAGESVPADAHLLEIKNLTVDESVFTGKKTPVAKITGSDSVSEELKKSCIYKGTKIVSGELVARVTGTGVDTRYFKEFGAVKETDEYYTNMEKVVLRVSHIFTAIAAVMLVIGAFAFIKVRVDIPFLDVIFNTFYPAAAFSLCFIPAETASLVRLYYIRGAQKLEERSIRVKNLRTVEYINAATCILIDKNAVVTKKSMQIADKLTANEEMLTNISVLACKKDSDSSFDQAIFLDATFRSTDVDALTENELLKEYPFDENEGAAGNLWSVGGSRLLCIKGAPEKLLPLCDVPNDMLYTVQNKQISYGQQGYNVLAVAFAKLPDDAELPEKISSAHYSFMGLIAFDTPTKDYIPAAILGCQKAGARVIMTSGDSAETSFAIAKKVGIKGDRVITGDMLASGEELDLTDVGVFARITDEMKGDIIRRLQDNGEVVMITGDTASDSDLLEIADVGVSIANNVSGAAFEECDVVVGNTSFETVTDILSVARQAHLNIKRCISVSIVALIVMVLFALFDMLTGTNNGANFVISPVLGSLISVILVPAAAYMFCENTADLRNMTAPSEYIGRGKLKAGFFVRPLIQGLGLLFAEVIYYLISSGFGNTVSETINDMLPYTRSGFLIIFTVGLMFACISNISDRSIADAVRAKQMLPWTIAGISFAVSLMLVFIPVLNGFFGFGTPDIMSLLISIVITVILQLPAELIRFTSRRIKE